MDDDARLTLGMDPPPRLACLACRLQPPLVRARAAAQVPGLTWMSINLEAGAAGSYSYTSHLGRAADFPGHHLHELVQ